MTRKKTLAPKLQKDVQDAPKKEIKEEKVKMLEVTSTSTSIFPLTLEVSAGGQKTFTFRNGVAIIVPITHYNLDYLRSHVNIGNVKVKEVLV